MKDIRITMLKEVISLLQPVGIEIYSVLPDGLSSPFFYIADITSYEVPNKSSFNIEGQVEIELFTGTNKWVGSLSEPLKNYYDAKYYLQPTKGFTPTLYGFNVSVWTIAADTGLQQYSSTERMFVGTLIFRYVATQDRGYIERVEMTDGTVEAIDCLPVEMR